MRRLWRVGSGGRPRPMVGRGHSAGPWQPGGEGDPAGVGEGLPGQGLAAEQPPRAFLQVQPARLLGDDTCWSRGWRVSQSRVATLAWLERLSVTTMTSPVGLACSTSARSAESGRCRGTARCRRRAGRPPHAARRTPRSFRPAAILQGALTRWRSVTSRAPAGRSANDWAELAGETTVTPAGG